MKRKITCARMSDSESESQTTVLKVQNVLLLFTFTRKYTERITKFYPLSWSFTLEQSSAVPLDALLVLAISSDDKFDY